MPSFTFTRAAEEDLLSIWRHIAEDDEHAATRLLRKLEKKFYMLARLPRVGPARPDLAPDLRYLPVGNYLVLYREQPDGVCIVRVLHGAQLSEALHHTS